ncbi:MAG: hypothetical protein AAGH53_02560 [Pseudomonadota bacterium]
MHIRPDKKRKTIKAAGLFGKVTPRMALPEALPAEKPVPECAAFEEDFASYLKRLKHSAKRKNGTVTA